MPSTRRIGTGAQEGPEEGPVEHASFAYESHKTQGEKRRKTRGRGRVTRA